MWTWKCPFISPAYAQHLIIGKARTDHVQADGQPVLCEAARH
jgi:hypothetical protein